MCILICVSVEITKARFKNGQSGLETNPKTLLKMKTWRLGWDVATCQDWTYDRRIEEKASIGICLDNSNIKPQYCINILLLVDIQIWPWYNEKKVHELGQCTLWRR